MPRYALWKDIVKGRGYTPKMKAADRATIKRRKRYAESKRLVFDLF